jgi:alpha-ketoglutarate-dependent 2,4-dichlorophenoxyacetate dioxygenase
MSVITRQIGQCFAAEIEGINMAKPLSADEVDAIHAAMDRYAVLVFRDQDVDDEQQLAFTRGLGDIEHAIGTSLRAPDDYRLPTTFADVPTWTRTARSSPATIGGGCSASATACGTPTAPSRPRRRSTRCCAR